SDWDAVEALQDLVTADSGEVDEKLATAIIQERGAVRRIQALKKSPERDLSLAAGRLEHSLRSSENRQLSRSCDGQSCPGDPTTGQSLGTSLMSVVKGNEGGQTTFSDEPLTAPTPNPIESSSSASSQAKGGLFGDGTLYEQSFPRYDEAYLGLATGAKPLVLTTAGRKGLRAPWAACASRSGQPKVHPLKMSRLRADYPRSFAVMEGLQPYGTSKARLFPDDGDLTNPRLLPRAITCTELLSPECAKQLAPRLTGSQERLSGQTRYIGLDLADGGKS
ncbi:hypothetical protein FOZ63_031490, partial [Perkinsus olseni]